MSPHCVEMRPQSRSIWLFLIFALLLSGCEAAASAAVPTIESAFAIDPKFREYYELLGGADTLGPAVSPLRLEGAVQYQYTANALMIFDPQAPAQQRYHLAPVGLDMGIAEPAVLQPTRSDLRFVEGHIIHPDFVALYDRLGGAPVVGKPLTEVHLNPQKKRYEQYFENVGFYRLEGEPAGTGKLLAYGSWKCGSDCRTVFNQDSSIVLHAGVEPPFSDAVARLGSDFTGFALTAAYLAADGKVEQVFENVVLAVDMQSPDQVFLRPVLEKVGILPDPPAGNSGNPSMVFFPVDGELGYNIPLSFISYIEQRGGMEVTGPPIMELSYPRDHVFRQCFANLCLDSNENSLVRPAPLGYAYKELYYRVDEQPSPDPAPQGEAQKEELRLQKMFPLVSSTQEQEIRVGVEREGAPVVGARPVLILTLPDGAQQTFVMAPTGSDGMTYQRLTPVSAPNGTLIPYEVCLESATGEDLCFEDSYLIWNNP